MPSSWTTGLHRLDDDDGHYTSLWKILNLECSCKKSSTLNFFNNNLLKQKYFKLDLVEYYKINNMTKNTSKITYITNTINLIIYVVVNCIYITVKSCLLRKRYKLCLAYIEVSCKQYNLEFIWCQLIAFYINTVTDICI